MWLSRCRILTLAPLSCTFGHVHPSKDFNSQPRASPSQMPPPNLSCNIAQDLRFCPTPDCGNNSSTGQLQEQPLHLLPDPVPPPVRSPLLTSTCPVSRPSRPTTSLDTKSQRFSSQIPCSSGQGPPHLLGEIPATGHPCHSCSAPGLVSLKHSSNQLKKTTTT